MSLLLAHRAPTTNPRQRIGRLDPQFRARRKLGFLPSFNNAKPNQDRICHAALWNLMQKGLPPANNGRKVIVGIPR